ncbi:MAG: 23S rRNA (adenine(2503)-C(2))-methyltransferase RlmN [Opitutae bacterium]|jgi:23S rRNA (adenine2503-C2)-methyltransferase|nr:23S rRNA (adenine(2503)-C(2))-methyltransferase RlmN [Opitutae bacterium]MBT5914832.1 23S rRNA (adenine(2503)-C(2))-methyltransferase RlmN [Opitutae bacterium]MBT7406191.1 23S rRNA (adenine(2503)-C(2))-methyltransferase RlmN [Opitutae bacterium]
MVNLKQSKPLLIDTPFEEWQLKGLPSYRNKQIREWIYEKGILDFEKMSNLSLGLREDLKKEWDLMPMELSRKQGSEDTTQKFLWKLRDGQLIESVLIPATEGTKGVRASRLTLCVSTQVGCALGCKFCASGLDGLKRNLTTGEIIGQILIARAKAGRRIDNLVFMGMGEPLANLPAMIPALDQILSPDGLGIGARHITLSTSGLVPKILELAKYPAQIRLAISLHGGDNRTREQIMPINKRYPIEELIDACERFIEERKKMITLEYILIKGVNDDLGQAILLARHARRLNAKVNLIPYNKVEGMKWERPELSQINAFRSQVEKENAPRVTLRMEKGHDIDAACGQLRLRETVESC